MNKKQILALLLSAMFLLGVCLMPIFADPSEDPSGDVSSEESSEDSTAPFVPSEHFDPVNPLAAYCVDTDQMLYEYETDKPIYPGVACKLMTAIVAYDLLTDMGESLSTEVTVNGAWTDGSYYDGRQEFPYWGLKQGERVTVEFLLGKTLVCNMGDTCMALAEYCASRSVGTRADFVARMNARAEQLGMTNTRFADPVGVELPYGGGKFGRTTVGDTVKLVREFYKYDALVKLSDASAYGNTRSKNHLKCNYFLPSYYCASAIGLIAGQATLEGEYMLCTAVEKDGFSYIFVVGGACGEQIGGGTRSFARGNAYEDMLGLIPRVLNAYGVRTVCTKTDIIAELRMGDGADHDFVRLVPAEDIEMLIDNPDDDPIESEIIYCDKVYTGYFNGKKVYKINPPIKQGDVLGQIVYRINGKEIARTDLVAETSVGINSLKTTFAELYDFLFNGSMGTIVKITLAVTGLWLAVTILALIIRLVRRIVRRRQGLSDEEEEEDDDEEFEQFGKNKEDETEQK